MSDYQGKASIVTSTGDALATGDLDASNTPDGDSAWTGRLSNLLWGSHMVPQPFNASERLRLEGLDDKPIVQVSTENLDGGDANLTCDEDVLG